MDDDLRDAVEADLRVFFHVDPDTLAAPDYFRMAYYCPAYSGAVGLFYKARAEREAAEKTPGHTGAPRGRQTSPAGHTAPARNNSPRNDLPPHLRGRSDVRVVEATRAGIMNSDLAAVIEMD